MQSDRRRCNHPLKMAPKARAMPAIQSAVALFWRYQLAGLQSLLAPPEH